MGDPSKFEVNPVFGGTRDVVLRRNFRWFRTSAGFGSATTARQLVDRHGDRAAGAVALVTGCTIGSIGYVTARELARAGCTVLVAGRNLGRVEAAIGAIRAEIPSANLVPVELDLTSLDSVRAASARILADFPVINLLICNAGIMATPFELTVDGYEKQFATNHLGHFLLVELLVPAVRRGAAGEASLKPETASVVAPKPPLRLGRIILVSSVAHSALRGLQKESLFDPETFNDPTKYHPFLAYGRSKLANGLHARSLARREAALGSGVVVASLHPGTIPTNLLDDNLRLPACVLRACKAFANNVPLPAVKTLDQGAATTIYCALHDADPSFDIRTADVPYGCPGSPTGAIRSGLYYEDCAENNANHPWMADPALEEILWRVSVKLTDAPVGRDTPNPFQVPAEG